MNTERTNQLGNDIKVGIYPKVIYDSDEDNSELILTQQKQSGLKETRNSGTLNDTLDISNGTSPTNKLKNTSYNLQGQEKLVFDYLDLTTAASNFDNKSESENCHNTSGIHTTENKKWASGDTGNSRQEEEDNNIIYLGRKRNSEFERSFPKRVKIEFDDNMSEISKNQYPDIELELENFRPNEPVKRRNINTIIEELELIGRKFKEGYERFKLPVHWGTPIVKHCSEKWDSHYIPEKLIELYEKRLEASQTCHASYISVNTENVSDSQNECKSLETKSNRNSSDSVDEEAFEAADYDNFDSSNHQIEDGLNAYNSNVQGKMTLRTRNQTRRALEERISNEPGRDNMSIEKQSRKQSSKSNKDKKLNNSRKRIVAELDRSQDSHSKYQNEENLDSNKNFENVKMEDLASPSSPPMNTVKSHLEEKAIISTSRIVEEEQVACPICGKNFEKKRIESHANHCATETFRD